LKQTLRKILWILLLVIGGFFLLIGLLIIDGNATASGTMLLLGGLFLFFGFKQRKKYLNANLERLANKKKMDDAAALEVARIERDKKFGDFEFKVTGVTYENEDGSSRQKILKSAIKAQKDGTLDITFERHDYNGQPGVSVMFNGKCGGYVESRKAVDFLNFVDQITYMSPEISSFINDEGRRIYFCHISFVYRKEKNAIVPCPADEVGKKAEN